MVDEQAQHEADCKEAVERLYHFLDGELTDERRVMIQRHLDACSDCIEAFEFEVELRAAIVRGAGSRSPSRCGSGSSTPSGRSGAGPSPPPPSERHPTRACLP